MTFSFPSRLLTAAALALGLAATTGCATSFTPGRTAGFDVDTAAQIDDEDIKKAFEARPQLPGQLRVAYYSFDATIAKDLEPALASVPGISSVYRIPPLLVSGERRFDEGAFGRPAREVTVKKLRLLAARAHCDALVVVDHGYRGGGANGLAALNILLVPMLFVPFIDNTTESYADAYLIDTRNGYLYGHVTEDDKRGDKFVTVYGKGAREVAEEQWKTLRAAMVEDLGKLVAGSKRESEAAKGAAAVGLPVAR